MPIVMDSDKSHPSLNGDANNSMLFNSLDDESFVVLERSTANDVGLDVTSHSPHSFQTLGQPNSYSFPVFNNLSGRMSSSQTSQSQTIPVETLGLPFDSPNISVSGEEIEKRLKEVLDENLNLKENIYQTNLVMKQQLNAVRFLQDRAFEVQKNHQSKFEETKTLILKLESDKNELQETNNLVSGELNKLKEEYKELKETNVAFGTETAKLLSENASLKQQVSALQDTFQTLSENGKKASSQPTAKEVELHELVDQLTRKLELVERARRQQDFDIDRLQAQLGRATQELNELQRKLAHSENALELAQTQVKAEVKIENSLQYGEQFLKYDGLLKQLKASIDDERSRFNSLNSWLSMTDPAGNSSQFEISELRRLLAEEQSQSVARKESLFQAVSTIHEMLNDFQKLGEELERVKADYAVKESHGLAYDEMQKKGFRERLDSLTAKLVQREEALAISDRHLASLQEAVRLQNDEKKDDEEMKTIKEQVQSLTNDVASKEAQLLANTQEINSLKGELQKCSETESVLKEQVNIYMSDFEAERKSREALVGEKERLLEDLRHLQRRNQELIDEIGRIRNGSSQDHAHQASSNTNPRRHERSPSPPPPMNSEHLAIGKIGPIFHEKQDGYLCGQHCLNALLQAAHFNAVDLAEIAQEIDFAEKSRMAEAGINSNDYQSFIKKPSENMDDTGFFSVQVISCALQLWGLELVAYSSTDPRAVTARTNPVDNKAFICNSNSHWFTIRRFGKRWFNLNSSLKEPEPISDLYLDLFLSQFQQDGNSVFVVFGDLPPCPADRVQPTQTDQENKPQLEQVPSRSDDLKLENAVETNLALTETSDLVKVLRFIWVSQSELTAPAQK